MPYSKSLGELLFGGNKPESIAHCISTLSRAYYPQRTHTADTGEISPEEAKELLAYITHPEIRTVVDSLEQRMRARKHEVRYSVGNKEHRSYLTAHCIIGSNLKPDKTLLVWEEVLKNYALLKIIGKLIAAAHPNYSVNAETTEIVCRKSQ